MSVNMQTPAGFSLPRRRLLGAMMAPLVVSRTTAEQSKRGSDVRTRPAVTSRFRMDIPEKDWRLLPGGVSTHGYLVHKDYAAAVLLEYELLQIALASEDIDANFAELELGTIKEREPSGTAFAARVEQVGRRRMVIVEYRRRGASGEDQVRLFVSVEGRHLYRLVCVAPSAQFARYAATFQMVCSSFSPLDVTA
jgi:hypothetical protein